MPIKASFQQGDRHCRGDGLDELRNQQPSTYQGVALQRAHTFSGYKYVNVQTQPRKKMQQKRSFDIGTHPFYVEDKAKKICLKFATAEEAAAGAAKYYNSGSAGGVSSGPSSIGDGRGSDRGGDPKPGDIEWTTPRCRTCGHAFDPSLGCASCDRQGSSKRRRERSERRIVAVDQSTPPLSPVLPPLSPVPPPLSPVPPPLPQPLAVVVPLCPNSQVGIDHEVRTHAGAGGVRCTYVCTCGLVWNQKRPGKLAPGEDPDVRQSNRAALGGSKRSSRDYKCGMCGASKKGHVCNKKARTDPPSPPVPDAAPADPTPLAPEQYEAEVPVPAVAPTAAMTLAAPEAVVGMAGAEAAAAAAAVEVAAATATAAAASAAAAAALTAVVLPSQPRASHTRPRGRAPKDGSGRDRTWNAADGIWEDTPIGHAYSTEHPDTYGVVSTGTTTSAGTATSAGTSIAQAQVLRRHNKSVLPSQRAVVRAQLLPHASRDDGGASSPRDDGGASSPRDDGGAFSPRDDGGASSPRHHDLNSDSDDDDPSQQSHPPSAAVAARPSAQPLPPPPPSAQPPLPGLAPSSQRAEPLVQQTGQLSFMGKIKMIKEALGIAAVSAPAVLQEANGLLGLLGDGVLQKQADSLMRELYET